VAFLEREVGGEKKKEGAMKKQKSRNSERTAKERGGAKGDVFLGASWLVYSLQASEKGELRVEIDVAKTAPGLRKNESYRGGTDTYLS